MIKLLSALTILFISSVAFSQTYEQRLQMTKNKDKILTKDIRYLIINAPASNSEDDMVAMLESLDIPENLRNGISVELAFSMNRYELSVYMAENLYNIPTKLSRLFIKHDMRAPGQPLVKNYSDKEMIKYMDYFIDKGMAVDADCIFQLENFIKRIPLRDHAISRLTREGKIEYDGRVLLIEFRQSTINHEKIDSLLATSEYKITDQFMHEFTAYPVKTIKEIVARGGNVNAVNRRGEMFLMRVIKNGKPQVVEYLINNAEIDLCAKDKDAQDVLYYLKSKASKGLKKHASYKDFLKKVKATCK